MSEDDSIDRESLTSNTVAKQEICKNRGLLVSGKKSELVMEFLRMQELSKSLLTYQKMTIGTKAMLSSWMTNLILQEKRWTRSFQKSRIS